MGKGSLFSEVTHDSGDMGTLFLQKFMTVLPWKSIYKHFCFPGLFSNPLLLCFFCTVFPLSLFSLLQTLCIIWIVCCKGFHVPTALGWQEVRWVGFHYSLKRALHNKQLKSSYFVFLCMTNLSKNFSQYAYAVLEKAVLVEYLPVVWQLKVEHHYQRRGHNSLRLY